MEGRKKEKRERRRKDKKYEEEKGRKEIVTAHQGDELRVNCLALLLLSQTLETKGRHKDMQIKLVHFQKSQTLPHSITH